MHYALQEIRFILSFNKIIAKFRASSSKLIANNQKQSKTFD